MAQSVATKVLGEALEWTPLDRNVGVYDIRVVGENSVIARAATTLVFLWWKVIDTERRAFVTISTRVGLKTLVNVLLTLITPVSVDASAEGFP